MKRKTWLVLILGLFLTACAKSKNTYLEAQYLFQTEEYYEASQVLAPLAAKGNARAQYALGYLYYYGLGVLEDEDVALDWFARAARQDYPQAEEALQQILEDADRGRY